jgi:hypothetical protein
LHIRANSPGTRLTDKEFVALLGLYNRTERPAEVLPSKMRPQQIFDTLTWPLTLSSSFGRSELAMQYYDEILFHGLLALMCVALTAGDANNQESMQQMLDFLGERLRR